MFSFCCNHRVQETPGAVPLREMLEAQSNSVPLRSWPLQTFRKHCFKALLRL